MEPSENISKEPHPLRIHILAWCCLLPSCLVAQENPPESGLEWFVSPSFGVSYMTSGRDQSPTPPEAKEASDALKLGGLLAIQAGLLGRESGLGLAVFHEVHVRSTSAPAPFSISGEDQTATVVDGQDQIRQWTLTYDTYEPSLEVFTTGLAVTKRGTLGSPRLHWTATAGAGYVFTVFESSYHVTESDDSGVPVSAPRSQAAPSRLVVAAESGYSSSWRETGNGSAILLAFGLDWSLARHVSIGTETRMVLGKATTSERVSEATPLLGVASQRIDHFGLLVGARLHF